MRHRHLFLPFAFVLAAGAVASAPAAFAQQAAPAQAGNVSSLTELPYDILLVIGPDVSDRGGPFAPGCVSVKGEPHSRFVSARMGVDTAQVTIERGGFAHYFDTLDFRRVEGRWVHVPKHMGPAVAAQAAEK
jgi:hypothetical protein